MACGPISGKPLSTSLRSARDATLAPAYRVVLLSLFVAPIGGVLVQANVLRDLVITLRDLALNFAH